MSISKVFLILIYPNFDHSMSLNFYLNNWKKKNKLKNVVFFSKFFQFSTSFRCNYM